MGTTSRLIMIASFVLLAAFTSLEAWFAPKAELDSRWLPSDPAATERVDHSAWDWLLKAYVVSGSDGINRVAYARVTAVDRQALADYIARLAATPVTKLNRAEQRTYWINLYNALTVQLVLGHYPLGSIRDAAVKGGPWKSKLVTVEGVPLSLDEIEHHILRPIWHDPRIHYAVNCASLGCPNLQPTAFTADNTERLLEEAARAYVNHPRGVDVADDGRIIVSSIYVWFEEDFGGSDKAVIRHLAGYAEPDLRQRLSGRSSIDAHRYDWSLNDAATGP